MSVFKEIEVRSGAFFKEVRLQLVRSAHVDPHTDWFDHERYIKNDLKRQQAIKPPYHLIKFKEAKKASETNKQVVIDLETPAAKPNLVPEWLQGRNALKQKVSEFDL